ncbi:hypothetical protein IM816_02895 [Luteibacter flocculans]|uniref:Uncharacterized protein n=1 Tax=Luteibacter flocculans TaxID=2780091 RepID=A0ABY4T2C4_9GAMM|nr:hypothetical protein [Luteibacter flocculans]URL59081.1 hypothetical protein IM816_02895 [Luteibacter flocculans]
MKTIDYPSGPDRSTSPFSALALASNSVLAAQLHEPRIFWGNSADDAEEIPDVPIWGTYFPVTAGHADMRVVTAALPLDALVSVRWLASDGSAGFSSPPVPSSGQDLLIIPLPDDKRRPFEGKDVDVTYSVHLRDGSVVVSPTRSIKVTRFLTFTPPVIEGVADDGLYVPDYPNGLSVRLGPVGNGELFQDITCNWGIYIAEDNLLISLFSLIQRLPYGTNADYHFWIPPLAYTNFPAEAFCVCFCRINLVPYPSRFGWGLGGRAFDLLLERGTASLGN